MYHAKFIKKVSFFQRKNYLAFYREKASIKELIEKRKLCRLTAMYLGI